MLRSRRCLFYILFLRISVLTIAQDSKEYAVNYNEVEKEKRQSINLYYGLSVYNIISDYKLFGTDNKNLKYKTVGPVGVLYEYMINDKVGLGAEINYYDHVATYERDGITGTGSQQKYVTYQYKDETKVIRALFRFSKHIFTTQTFNAYYFGGVGYRNFVTSYTSNNPDVKNITVKSNWPIALKAGFGLRYYLYEDLGINFEIAAGTPIIGGGLSYKF